MEEAISVPVATPFSTIRLLYAFPVISPAKPAPPQHRQPAPTVLPPVRYKPTEDVRATVTTTTTSPTVRVPYATTVVQIARGRDRTHAKPATLRCATTISWQPNVSATQELTIVRRLHLA